MQNKSPSIEELKPGRIMVVDDEENARLILRRILEQDGHEVVECIGGKEALEHFKHEVPDLVLLDVVMQGINGKQVCRTLKNDPETAPIPILLISGFDQRKDRLEGIAAGANDFISKPIDFKDVSLRVRNSLYTKRLYDQTQEAYSRLKELERSRESLTHMIVHDVRSPLTGLMGYLELLQNVTENELSDDNLKMLQTARKLADIIMHMIQSMLDLDLLENQSMPLNTEENDLVPIIREVLSMLQPKLQSHRIDFNPPRENIYVWCDGEATRRIFTNLLTNAAHFTPKNSTIRLALTSRKEDVLIEVIDHGPGIKRKNQDKLFQKFGFLETTAKNDQRSTGLGLAYCKLATEAQGGGIGVESEVNRGSKFWFTLPRCQPEG